MLCPTGVRVATDSDTTIPKKKDFFFGYATASGYLATRDPDNGSRYIIELCRSLAQYARFMCLDRMMKVTNAEVMGPKYKELKQPIDITHDLDKDVFFFW